MARSAKKAGRRRPETITQLYQKFERADAAARAVPENNQKLFDRKLSAACDLAHAIARSPARTVREMLLKIRVAAWDVGDMKYKTLQDLDHWKPTNVETEYHVLKSLREDLERLVRQGNIPFDQPFNPSKSRAA